jgi:hypothetical protein
MWKHLAAIHTSDFRHVVPICAYVCCNLGCKSVHLLRCHVEQLFCINFVNKYISLSARSVPQPIVIFPLSNQFSDLLQSTSVHSCPSFSATTPGFLSLLDAGLKVCRLQTSQVNVNRQLCSSIYLKRLQV